MNDRFEPFDLDPAERDLHRLLAAVPPRAVPMGFRDEVMSRLRNEHRVAWEWIVALVLAVPNLLFLARQIALHGDDFARAMGNVMSAAISDPGDAFFFVDGLTVVALALVGISCAVAAHALYVTSAHRPVAR